MIKLYNLYMDKNYTTLPPNEPSALPLDGSYFKGEIKTGTGYASVTTDIFLRGNK